MAYNPGVQNRSAEFLAQGIGGAFKSVTDAMELRRARTDEINKTDGELKAFGQTLQGLVKLGTIPQSAADDYNNVLGADVKTKQGYLNQSVKSLNLIFEADRNKREKLQSESAIAVNKAQLDQITRANLNNEALTKAMGSIPTDIVSGTDRGYVQGSAPKANLNDFLYGKQLPPVSKVKGMVPVVPPFESADLLYEDTEAGKFRVITDTANRLKKAQENKISSTNNEILALEDLLNKGRQESSYQAPASDIPALVSMPNLSRTPILPSERATLVPQLTNLKKRYDQENEALTAIEKRITSAEKFEGTPLSKKAGDPVVKSAIKILELPSIIERELKSVEVKKNRPLTSEEKASFLVSEYIKKGGELTPKILSDIKDSTKLDFEVIKNGDVTAVRMGNQTNIFRGAVPVSAAIGKASDQKTYQQGLTLASQLGLSNLSASDRARLAELHGEFGDVNRITGVRFALNEAINSRARDYSGGKAAVAETFINPTAGTSSSIGRFNVIRQDVKK